MWGNRSTQTVANHDVKIAVDTKDRKTPTLYGGRRWMRGGGQETRAARNNYDWE